MSRSWPCGVCTHLGVELDAVEAPLRVLEGGDRRRRRAAGHRRARRRRGDGVAVAHPDRLLLGQPVEERPGAAARGSVLPNSDTPVRSTRAAELERQQLHAVADAERRDAELEDTPDRPAARRPRTPTPGPPERMSAQRVARSDLVRRERVRDELRVDARLAHAPRDQLRVLAAEVEHEDGPLLVSRLGHRQRDDLTQLATRGRR